MLEVADTQPCTLGSSQLSLGLNQSGFIGYFRRKIENRLRRRFKGDKISRAVQVQAL